MQKTKALALISGGLDSILATKLILNQGVHVEGINFFTGFTGDQPDTEIKKYSARWAAELLGIKLHIINVVDEYQNILLHPKFGYGANLNPCLDCKHFMVNKAKEWMDKNGFDFLITGEVIGQRPKSQLKRTMPIVAKDTDNRLLRPLCAKLLAPTLPELCGQINRELLLAFNGRNRKPQIELAKQLGITDYPQPGGGCLLTDIKYCDRLKDFLHHHNAAGKKYSLDDILLLKIGRHLRPDPNVNLKLVIGRDEKENMLLEKYLSKFAFMQSQNHPGALVLLQGDLNKENLELAARIAARFSQGCNSENVVIRFNDPIKQLSSEISVTPMPASEILNGWYI